MKSIGIRKLIGILAVALPSLALAQAEQPFGEATSFQPVVPEVPFEVPQMESEVKVRFHISADGKIVDLHVLNGRTETNERQIKRIVRVWELKPQVESRRLWDTEAEAFLASND